MKKINDQRIHLILDHPENEKGDFILYWMNLSFRTHWNYSLEYAVGLAEKHHSKVLVLVNITPRQTHRTERHIYFLLQGLRSVRQALQERQIKMVLRIESLQKSLEGLAEKAIAVVTDFPYLKEQQNRLRDAKEHCEVPLIAVESNVIVPVEVASDKQEYAARTIRPKLMDQYEDYLEKPVSSELPKSSLNMQVTGVSLDDLDELTHQFQYSEHTEIIGEDDPGGFPAAKEQLNYFLDNQLSVYDAQRQSPTDRAVSELSKYLAMGMIAPAYIVSRLQRKSDSEDAASFLEELLVRRELAYNFVHYCADYDSLSALPDWAHTTLEQHKEDERAHSYTRKEFEAAETHDEAWNECMRRMKTTGYLHNHMRMYWGKQILAWSNTPQYAHKTLLYLNNKYFLDGNDPNSYANALWVFGLHDRAWQENKVFGKVRLMNRNGLERKIDIATFVEN